MNGDNDDFEQEYGAHVFARREATYLLLAKEKEMSFNDVQIYLCKIAGLDQLDASPISLTSSCVEKLAGLELYKFYKEDPSKKHLAKYARHAIDVAFDL